MPCTSLCFLIGAVAICGLPPLNGFVSELFIYLALLQTFTQSERTLAGVALAEWIGTAIEDRLTPPPVKAARTFLSALSDGRMDDVACKRALSLLSESGRSVFEAQAEEARARDARRPARRAG